MEHFHSEGICLIKRKSICSETDPKLRSGVPKSSMKRFFSFLDFSFALLNFWVTSLMITTLTGNMQVHTLA